MAGRIEDYALIGDCETAALVEGYFSCKSLGQLPVRGMPKPVEVFQVLGTGKVRSRLEASAARGVTRFVGRSAETAQLHQCLERVCCNSRSTAPHS